MVDKRKHNGDHQKMQMITNRTREIYKKGQEKWCEAVARASKELKKEGRL